MKYNQVVPKQTQTDTDHAAAELDPSFRSGIRFMDVTDDAEVGKPPFILSVYGSAGAGKSRLIGSAPGDIGVLALEYKSLPSIIAAAKEFEKRVIVPVDDNGPINLVRSSRAAILAQLPAQCITPEDFKQYAKDEDRAKAASRAMQVKIKTIKFNDEPPSCCQQCFYRFHFNREKACGLMLAAMPSIRTIAIDTFGQFVEDALFACYGRTEAIMPLDKKSFNQEIRDFLNCISGKNVILTHHMTQVWADNKPTSRTKPASTFNKLEHYTTATCVLARDKKAEVGDSFYKLTIEDCMVRPDLIGTSLLDTDISFLSLASKIYPDTDIDVWV